MGTMAYNEERMNKLKESLRLILRKDMELNNQGLPAMNRLNELQNLVNECYALRTLVDTELLILLKEWLEPLPDKTTPNFKIKNELLQFLLTINVTKDQLVESHVGKIVNFYSKSKREPSDTVRLSKYVLKKWRLIAMKNEE